MRPPCIRARAAALIVASLAQAGCAAPHLTLFASHAKPPASATQASEKPVCTPEMGSPVDPVPLATDGPYRGFLLVAPQTDAEKAGFDVARAYFGDLLNNAQAAHDRLQRSKDRCDGKR